MASTLIHSVRLFDGNSTISQNGCILLKNGLISNILLMTPSPLPAAETVIDGTGHTVLPGLIDAHVHAHDGEPELKQALGFGVTTVLDMFNEPGHVQSLKALVKNRLDLADFRSSCHAATIEGGWPAPVLLATLDREIATEKIKAWPKLASPSEAEAFVLSNIEKGADYIKLMQESRSVMLGEPIPVPSPELQAAVVTAAHKHGLVTLAHALSQRETILALEAGVDGLAHCFCDEPPSQELVAAYKRNNSFLIPTLVVAASVTGEENESSEQHAEHHLSEKLLGEEGKSCFCKKLMMGRPACRVEYSYQAVKLLKENGMDIVAGTDTATGLAGTAFGLSFHQELSLYVGRCGFTPAEALSSATSVTARRFNLHDRGRLAEGLKADLLLVKGDPTDDIRCTMNITGVWRGGQALIRGAN
ncbi:uncharacterized protein LY89DRAFT_63513 [Mollisia scopiformis]|uniref:Amidohydrolase-related domain-containing protein n=1 Tax=Mollisia scopiformis TaxID=149040 RepID=A0A194X995_MOLSC|nr:uncharacterized protein LY89DRAFT_63513 [Mollisia scopiformis]KUJ16741.1 hypothetical protein LY89DRAFT_63513 [Mollisia scopiformis]